MVEFQTHYDIQEIDRDAVFTALNWLKDNMGAKIKVGHGDFDTFIIKGHVIDTVFVDAVDTVNAFNTQFGTKAHLRMSLDMSV